MNKYNLFFYPNICHICKAFGSEVVLKRCGNCSMIAYCSKEHQKQHWPQHKKLCDVISNTPVNKKLQNTKECHNNQETWTQWKMNFMLLVSIKIARKLQHYEKQMFQFMRHCVVCFDTNPKQLEDCLNCPCTSFCANHKNNSAHQLVCNQLKFCYILDVASQNYRPGIPQFLYAAENQRILLKECMTDFLKQYLKKNESWQLSIEEEGALISEYLTRPLSLLYAIKQLNRSLNQKSICIHIVGADISEIDGVELWEVLLHWLPDVISVKLILIGPEVYSDTFAINLCESCKYHTRFIIVENHTCLYENYVRAPNYTHPDFIIGYNAGLHECEDLNSERETWMQSVKLIAEKSCPFILTSYTESEAKKELSRVSEIVERNVKPVYFGKNPFCSLRPYRDFETDGIYYQNHYLIIYERF